MRKMNWITLSVLVVMLLALLLGGVGLVSAQDEKPVETVEVTLDEPVEEAGGLPEVALTWGQLLLLLGLTAVVAIPTGAGLMAILYTFMGRKDVRDTAEKLYLAQSPEAQKTITDLVVGFREVSTHLLSFFDAITDGRPNVDAQAAVKYREQILDAARPDHFESSAG